MQVGGSDVARQTGERERATSKAVDQTSNSSSNGHDLAAEARAQIDLVDLDPDVHESLEAGLVVVIADLQALDVLVLIHGRGVRG